ncbi:bacteriocin [Lactobacillus sp. CC-MHH1034]|uniref:bacteriocin n=1 Tax=Agrilactobacillus fermenti TaxID=2586909 RepID=UPI001E37B215|nr:bacteriocin [Agrilactobacillus fermenti]MCD2256100.1 bacteriocin [Agrilactobacillus fermenti]
MKFDTVVAKSLLSKKELENINGGKNEMSDISSIPYGGGITFGGSPSGSGMFSSWNWANKFKHYFG